VKFKVTMKNTGCNTMYYFRNSVTVQKRALFWRNRGGIFL